MDKSIPRKKLPETDDRKDGKQPSELKQAWEQIEATRAEVEVLRKTMVVLAEDQRMDDVLDTLLRYVHEVVPYTSATVLFDEEGGRLFVARESPSRSVNRPVIMLEVADHPLLQRAVLERKSVHLADAANEGDWREIKCLGKVGSCMAVPLVVGEMLQGLLLVASVNPETFTRALCGHVGLFFSVNPSRTVHCASTLSGTEPHALRKCQVESESSCDR